MNVFRRLYLEEAAFDHLMCSIPYTYSHTVCKCTSEDDDKFSLHSRKSEGKLRFANPEPI